MTHPFRVSALALAAAALLASCSFSASIGEETVSADEVEQQATEQFAQQFPVDAVECDEDLPAEVGAEIQCVLESEGKSFEMTATVTSIEGDQANFDLELTEEL